MQKKGQVTVFVIVGIIILLVAGLFFFAKNYYGYGIEPKVYIQGPLNSIKNEITKCVDEIISPSINLISNQGGSKNPTKYRLYESKNVKYLCQNIPNEEKCLNSMDPLQKVESQLQEELQDKLKSCISKDLLESKRGYTITNPNLKVNAKILQENILFEIDYPITIEKDGVTQKLSRINREIPDTPLGYLYNAAYDIVNSHSKHGNFEQLIYMLQKKGRIIIQVDKPYPDIIYILNKKDSNLKFMFAIEGEE